MENKINTPYKKRKSSNRFNIKQLKDNNDNIEKKQQISCSLNLSNIKDINDDEKQKPTYFKRIGSLKKLNAYKIQINQQNHKQFFSTVNIQNNLQDINKIHRIGTLKKITAVINKQKQIKTQINNNQEKENHNLLNSKNEKENLIKQQNYDIIQKENSILKQQSMEHTIEKEQNFIKENENEIFIQDKQKQQYILDNQRMQRICQQNKSLNAIIQQADTGQIQQNNLKIDLYINDLIKQNIQKLYNQIIQVLYTIQKIQQKQKVQEYLQKNLEITQENVCKEQASKINKRQSKNSQISMMNQSDHARTCPQRQLNTTIKTISQDENKVFTPIQQEKNQIKFTLKKIKPEDRKNSQPYVISSKKINSNFNVKKKNILNPKKQHLNGTFSANLAQQKLNQTNKSLFIQNKVNCHYTNNIVKCSPNKSSEKQNQKQKICEGKRNFRKKKLQNASVHSYIAQAKKQISYLK